MSHAWLRVVMRSARRRTVLLAVAALLASTLALVSTAPDTSAHEGHADEAASAATAASGIQLPSRFQDTVAIGTLSEPTALAFASDGTAFVGEKSGIIKAYDRVGGAYGRISSTYFADLSTQVENYWDRGLVGITVDPQWPTRPYVYVSYAYNRDPRDNPPVVPRWTTDPSSSYDVCPVNAGEGAGGNEVGCLAMLRVSRLTAVRNADDTGWQMPGGGETPLVTDSCLQFPSHASGGVEFGADGKLYATVGEGASFDTEDYGQIGYPHNCGDPLDEGGSLRSQDLRSTGDPTGLNGVVIRINPDTGRATTDSTTLNTSRIVAYGLRNPWRLTFRGATNDLWVGDVGGNNYEEINRIPDTSLVTNAMSTKANFGWPCFEGAGRNPGFDALDKPLCESLYDGTAPAPTAPYFSYDTRANGDLPGADCQTGTSSVSGVAFVPTSTSWPASYQGRLVFSDYARSCLWVMGRKANGDPDPASVSLLAQDVPTPVDLVAGPGGDLYYVDFGLDDDGVPTGGLGGVHRISYYSTNQPPTVALTADRTSGPAPLTVALTATASDPDGDPLSYTWDLDGNGSYGDGGTTTRTATTTYPRSGNVIARVKVTDALGAVVTDALTISPGNTAPVIGALTPAASRTWQVGETIAFSAAATDAQQTLAATDYKWSLSIAHCPSVCHVHAVGTFSGASGSFVAPDHEYPSHLVLSLSVTDDQGVSATRTVSLQPRSVDLTFTGSPEGVPLTVGDNDTVGTKTVGFIVGSRFGVSAPATYTVGGRLYTFTGWSDGGTRSHQVQAPAAATTYRATYSGANRAPTASFTASAESGTGPLALTLDGSGSSDPDTGEGDALTYAWDLDGDGFDDGVQPTATWTYGPGTHTARLRVTDSHGTTSEQARTITVAAAARLVTSPRRLRVEVDGVVHRTGWDTAYAVGTRVGVRAPLTQWHRGKRYEFLRWSDRGARVHEVTVGDHALYLKAVYRRVRG